MRKTGLEERYRCFQSFFLGGGGWVDSCLNCVECMFNLTKMRITNKAGTTMPGHGR